MDKKLLDSLNNLSLALEDISAALKDKGEAQSATAKAMKGGDFISEIKEINVGVKALQKDTKEILANQQTIMKMGKGASSSKKENVAEGLGKDKTAQKNFKEGLGVILLIAVAVLAIGVAFNLVGKVNFLAVIALSIALPLLAIGFAKVHKVLKEVGFDPKKDAINFIIAITAIAFGITAASWILSMVTPLSFSKFFTTTFIALMFAILAPSVMKFMMAFKDMSWSQLIKSVIAFPLILPSIALGIAFASWALQLIKPISFVQFLTAVGIGVVFAVISFGLKNMLKAFKSIGLRDLTESVVFLPLILPAIALGIALSSYALQLVKPVGFVQFLTAVGIALVFTVVAFGLRKMLGAFKGLSPAEALAASFMIPILLVAVSMAIAASSFFLSKIKTIGFGQFLTALGIAAVFTVLSFGIAKIANGMRRMKYSDLPKIPVFFVLVSIAILLSSHILSKTAIIPFGTLLKIAAYGVTLALVVVAIGASMMLLKKMGLSVKDALIGILLTVLVATAIMISSHILAAGNYKKYPDWKWALGVGLSFLAFAPAMVLLGSIAMSGVGALAILAGAAMVLLVAGTVVATSYILNKGKYDKYPSLSWALGVGAAMIPFGTAIVTLGGIAITGFGLGALAIIAGAAAVLLVAKSVVETSKILSKGKYSGGPSLGWTLSTGLVMTGFGLAVVTLGSFIVGTLGLGWLVLEAGAEAVSLIAQSIVDASIILQKGKYTGGPTKDWAEGIAITLGAFSPIYGMLLMSGIFSLFGGGGVGPDEFSEAIVAVSEGIVTAAGFFADNKSAFVNGPGKEWAEGVGTAIGAFAPVFQVLQDSAPGLFSSGGPTVEDMSRAIMTISRGIVDAAIFFGDPEVSKLFNTKGNYPSKKWGEGVGAALNAFAPVFKALHEDTGWFTSGDEVVDNMTKAIRAMSRALVSSAKIFSSVSPEAWKSYPAKGWADSVGESIGSFVELYKSLNESEIEPDDLSLVSKYARQMANTAAILGRNKKYFDIQIDPNFVKKMSKNILDYQNLVKSMSGYKTSSFASMLGMDPVQRVANGMVKIASAYDKLAKAVKSFSSALNGLDPMRVRSFTTLTGNIAMLSALDSNMFSNMLKVLESRSGVFAKMLNVQTAELSKRPTVKAGGVGGAISSKKKQESDYVDAKGETHLQKLDKIYKVLVAIKTEANSINMFIQTPKDDNAEMGSKGDG